MPSAYDIRSECVCTSKTSYSFILWLAFTAIKPPKRAHTFQVLVSLAKSL